MKTARAGVRPSPSPSPVHPVLSRRRFLKVSAWAAAAAATPGMSAASYARVPGANDRIHVGFIGIGLIGRIHLRNFHALPDVRVTALAETFRPRLEAAQSIVGGTAHEYRDFRKLL